MTDTVKLHVGYAGKTREGKRVEILERANSGRKYGYFVGDNELCYWSNGTQDRSKQRKTDIIGPWTEPDTEEPGPWIGWDGGECPVHPETLIEAISIDGIIHGPNGKTNPSRIYEWDDPEYIIAYRIIKEHKGPLELWATYDAWGILHECFSTEDGAILFREVKE